MPMKIVLDRVPSETPINVLFLSQLLFANTYIVGSDVLLPSFVPFPLVAASSGAGWYSKRECLRRW